MEDLTQGSEKQALWFQDMAVEAILWILRHCYSSGVLFRGGESRRGLSQLWR